VSKGCFGKDEGLRLGFYASWAFPRSYIKLLFTYRVFAEVVVIRYNRKGAVNRYGDICYIKSINRISVCPSGIPTVKRFFGIWIR
jgi:hypothetical protein